MNKNEILEQLSAAGDYVSGQELAQRLGISRAAVWKNIKLLRAEGYAIDSATNRGYRLSGGKTLLRGRIMSFLQHKDCDVRVLDTADSTNKIAKQLAAQGAPEGTVIIAREQTAGRGRLGRSFYSPAGSGLYMSIILRPDMPAERSLGITAAAAVAAAGAIEELSGKTARIKWVNDILLDGKKVCGILTEAALNCENGCMDYVVVGIGVNLKSPEGGFPGELADIAGAVLDGNTQPDAPDRLAALIIDRLLDLCAEPDGENVYRAYVGHSCVIGRAVKLVSLTGGSEQAEVLNIDRSYALLVRGSDGSERRVNTGEISLRF